MKFLVRLLLHRVPVFLDTTQRAVEPTNVPGARQISPEGLPAAIPTVITKAPEQSLVGRALLLPMIRDFQVSSRASGSKSFRVTILRPEAKADPWALYRVGKPHPGSDRLTSGLHLRPRHCSVVQPGQRVE
jgi:hypothetical protein